MDLCASSTLAGGSTKLNTMEGAKYYYIFGAQASNAYLNKDDEEALTFIEKLPKGDYMIYCYNEEIDHPSDLLAEFMGWGQYAGITYHEFVTISKFVYCIQ